MAGDPKKGPLDRASDRLGELVHLLKNNIIPGMRPKDQKMILDYLLEMVDDLIAANREISSKRVTQNERDRIKKALEDQYNRELSRKLMQQQSRADTRLREELQAQEMELREEFRKAIINQHLEDD